MSMPDGAYRVTYRIWLYDNSNSVEVQSIFTVDLDPGCAEQQDAAAQAGAEAVVASLQASYPDEAVWASRAYECRRAGDPWPAAEAEGT